MVVSRATRSIVIIIVTFVLEGSDRGGENERGGGER